jgi:hypothetical protein
MPARRLFACVALASMTYACSSDSQRSEAAYCTAVGRHLDQLNNPAITNEADTDATLGIYREVSNAAPLAVQPEWDTLVASLRTAATVTPGDPASVQLAADTAREAQPAATRISTYTAQRCRLQIGAAVPTTTPSASTIAPVATTG